MVNRKGERFGKDHARYEPYQGLHHSAGGFDGGQCVGEHEYYYRQRDSCSYRWQAVHRATTSDKGLYGTVAPKVAQPSIATAKKYFALKALTRAPGPKDPSKPLGDWLATAHPFRTAFSPWPNNPHHLLPDAELQDGIFDTAKSYVVVEDLIVQGLLGEQYNLNHWKNLMILPQQDKQACVLGLPTHPKGDAHQEYSARVNTRVKRAMKPYEEVVQAIRDAKPEHPEIDPKDIKGALEAISDFLHGKIVGLKAKVLARCKKDAINLNSFAAAISRKLKV